MKKGKRYLVVALAALSLVLSYSTARADTPNEANAKRFVTQAARAKSTFAMLHFGATFTGTSDPARLNVSRDSRIVPGHFALRVRYFWTGVFGRENTDVLYFFDERGTLYDLRAERTSAALLAPFDGANAVLGLVKEAIKDLAKGDPNERAINDFVMRSGNARELLLLRLRLEQALGR